MRAIWYKKQGDASKVLVFDEMDRPTPQNDEVLVKVSFSGLNPSDTKRRSGFRGQTHAFPTIIPHSDGSGIIIAVGSDIDNSRIGERVWLYSAQWQRPFGTAANFVSVPSRLAIPLVNTTSLEIGATIGIPALTAYAGMFRYSNLSGSTILITGGGGSVGNCAIQMAKYAGAYVISSVSGQEKMTAAYDAGADNVLNYNDPNFTKEIMDITGGKKVDLIFDVAFGINIDTNLEIIKEHGIISTYASDKKSVAEIPFQKFLLMNLTVYSVFMYLLEDEMMQDALQFIENWQKNSGIKPFIAKQFRLADTALAHEELESGNTIGNIIIDCRD